MSLTLLALWLVAAPGRSFPDERHLLDRRLETLRRLLPDGANPASDLAMVRELGNQARLTRLELQTRPAAESGGLGVITVDLKATGRFAEIERFFRQTALSPRPIDVEYVVLTDAPGTIQVASALRLPYRPRAAPLVALPDGARSGLAGVPKPRADAYLRDQALALDKSQTLAGWRRSQRNPRLFLSELAAIVKERPVVLTQARFGEEFSVRGLTVGEANVRALESRFERGFFRLSDFVMSRQGACLRFEARGRAPVVGPEAALPLPTDDPFVQDHTPCRVDRDPDERTLSVKAGSAGKAGSGPYSLRLRDVDLADVFYVLHLLSGQSFVVDGDVQGRASVEFLRVSLDEALAALSRQANLRLTGSLALRRVSVERKTAPTPLTLTGGTPPATFTLKRGEVRDLLAVMSEADPGLAALGPPGSFGRASVWTKDAPLPDVRAALLAAAGLSERIEDGRRVLGEPDVGDQTRVPVAGSVGEERLELAAHDLAVAEFELAGVAAAGENWSAYAYAPTGRLVAYAPGAPLADGSVRGVQSTDVLLETDEGPLRVFLPPGR